jgi:HEAT repeat protein
MPAESSVDQHALEHEASEFRRLGTGMALAAVGLGKEVGAAAKSAASRVRQATATTLDQQRDEAQQAAHHAVDTARRVATRAVTQAQNQAFDSLANMPLEQAGPILLLAIAEGDPQSRRLAAERLAKRWPAAADFPVEAAVESRQTAILALRDLWNEQYGQLDRAVAAQAAEAQRLIELSEDGAREAQRLIATLRQTDASAVAREQAAAALEEFGPPLLSELERQIAENGPLPPEVYAEVLPAIKPAFAALVDLQSADVAQRRAAAAKLVVQSSSDVLPPLAVMQLSELVANENDPQVWQDALIAASSSAHQAAQRMANRALENASADVRSEACRYFAAHGNPRHAEALLKAMDDPELVVQLAAVRAMGSLETHQDPQPLLVLLDAQDKRLRVESALALARLRVERGTDALERLALSTDLELRLRAAQAMGEIADPLFLPSLVAMLEDQHDVQQSAMQGLARIAGRDVAATSAGEQLADEQRVARWRHWYADGAQIAARASENL